MTETLFHSNELKRGGKVVVHPYWSGREHLPMGCLNTAQWRMAGRDIPTTHMYKRTLRYLNHVGINSQSGPFVSCKLGDDSGENRRF